MIFMSTKNKLPFSAKLYLHFRPLIIPFDFIEKYVPKKGVIVDVGCGFGIFANYLASKSENRTVIGIDLNEKRILLAKKIYSNIMNLKFFCDDITDSKIPKADIVTGIDVLHHIPTLELQTKLLKSCFSILSENGKLILKEVDTKPLWKYWWNKIHDYLMTKGEPVLYHDKTTIKNLLEKIGFVLEEIIVIKKYPYAHILFISKKPTSS